MNRSSTGAFGVITATVASGRRPFAGGVVDRSAAIGWPDVWAVVKESAERRLGKPLLKAYFFLAVFGIVVISVSIVVMHL
jgi:hypothetical protein